jgi:transcriptional regulator with XRE-family HTH domain
MSDADRGDWGIVRLALTALLDNHAQAGVVSIRALAAVLGVDPKTAWKWLKGLNRPDPETQERIASSIKERRAAIRQQKQ